MLVLPIGFNPRSQPANGPDQERSSVKSRRIAQMNNFPARVLPSPSALSTRQGDSVADQAAIAYCSFAVIGSIEFLRSQRSSPACRQVRAGPVESGTSPILTFLYNIIPFYGLSNIRSEINELLSQQSFCFWSLHLLRCNSSSRGDPKVQKEYGIPLCHY